jgi:PAS domain S-box-containing protein
MSREEVFYLIPYLLSLALSAGIFIYTWRHRHMRGARVYSWFVGGQTLTILGFIFELVSPNLQTKILWDKFQWLTDSFLVFIPFLIFSVQFSEHKLRRPRLTWGFWIGIPILFTLLLLTDNIHHLLYPNPHLSNDHPFSDLQYDLTFVVYAYALLYIYGANILGGSLLIRRAIQSHNVYRFQYWTIIIGFLIPLVLSIFALAGIKITSQRDIAPFSFALGNLVVAWGLFRYRLFDIVPIARERVLENMADQVIVLDAQERVIDINQAALRTLGKKSSDIVGKPSSIVFSQWTELVERFRGINEVTTEVEAVVRGQTVYYELNISPIYDPKKQIIGHVIVAHDITTRKTLEDGYRQLSEELEQRVRERTNELHNSVERYRAVVENQTEFIVRWRPDGTRTFVNEAYCRYWGISVEEALSINFYEHIVEEDRSAVEEKISRLITGAVNSETETHKIIGPDGSICWQEWTDRTIRDEAGNLVEFLSVGRDVTERKQAEDALRKSEERFFKAFQASPIIITISQLSNSKLLEVNETFEKIFEYSHEQVIGKTTVELGLWANPKDREHLGQAILTGKPVRNEEYQFQTRSGNIITGLYSSELIVLGGEQCIISTVEDITERKKAEEIILSQLAFDKLLTKLQTRFSTAAGSEIDTAIETGLQEIASFIGVDRAFVIIVAQDRSSWSVTHEWFTHPASSIKKSSQEIPKGEFKWTEDRLLSGEVVKINTLDDFPPEAANIRKYCEDEGALSLLHVPISSPSSALIGSVGLDCHTHKIVWTDRDVTRLKIVGDAIAGILERKRAEENLAEAYDTTLEGWAKALELRDKETEGHSRRVTETTLAVARSMGFDEERLTHIRRGSILHDIGKMGIPDDILRKDGPLTEEERSIVLKHPTTAFDLLKPIPYLEKALEIPYCHHEKWNGTGYPRGLMEEEIPLAARIFAVVDVWDALSSDRPYRKAWDREKIEQYLIAESGKHFDPKVVGVFLKMVEKGEI